MAHEPQVKKRLKSYLLRDLHLVEDGEVISQGLGVKCFDVRNYKNSWLLSRISAQSQQLGSWTQGLAFLGGKRPSGEKLQ